MIKKFEIGSFVLDFDFFLIKKMKEKKKNFVFLSWLKNWFLVFFKMDKIKTKDTNRSRKRDFPWLF